MTGKQQDRLRPPGSREETDSVAPGNHVKEAKLVTVVNDAKLRPGQRTDT